MQATGRKKDHRTSSKSQMQKVCSENFCQFCAVCCDGVEARSMSGRRHAVGVAKMTGDTDKRHA